MPQHLSIQPGTLYPQPDYSVAVDREGKWTATQVFLCHRNSIVRLMPLPGTPHPEIPFSTKGKLALAKIQRGQTSYYSPKVTWRESRTKSKPVTATDLNKIGEIDTPKNAPKLAQKRTWLLNGITQSQEGSSFRIEKEWLASDPGGWDKDIYTI